MILKQADTAKLFATDQAMFEPGENIDQGSELIACSGQKVGCMKLGGEGVMKR